MLHSLKFFLQDIKIAHSVFAMPFALAMLMLAWNSQTTTQWLTLLQVLACLVCARSFAMGMNRVLDRTYDAELPRTSKRMIPLRKLSWQASLCWSLLFATVFVLLCANLNQTTLICSVPLLLLLASYPLTKRFSLLCHWYLGMCLGLTPVAVLIACGIEVSSAAVVLGASVMMWTAGFDIIYALQDFAYDKRRQLHSVPARLGVKMAVYVSQCCFLLVVLGFCLVGILTARSFYYWLGIAVCALLLFAEQYLLARSIADSSLTTKKINTIFFQANAAVSICFFLFVSLDVWVNARA